MTTPVTEEADLPVIAAYALVHGLSQANAAYDWPGFQETYRARWRGAMAAYATAAGLVPAAEVERRAAEHWGEDASEGPYCKQEIVSDVREILAAVREGQVTP